MEWTIRFVINTIINTFVIITAINIFFMGFLMLTFSKKSSIPCFMVPDKKNRIDIQNGNSCAGYAAAYVLRHHNIPADGEDIYRRFPSKTADGFVYPKEIKRMLEKYGFHVRYCAGNLNALKNEVSKGNPVIVIIKVRKNEKYLHCVPVTGYDEANLFIAESLADLVNCNEKTYNRKICNNDFKKLWNTSMLKMPLYTHTFYRVEKV